MNHNLAEENKKLREALTYARNAIDLITISWVHENHMPQVIKIQERIQELTPLPPTP